MARDVQPVAVSEGMPEICAEGEGQAMKTLIYYKNDGKITYHHTAPESWNREQLEEKAKEYNAHSAGKTAYIQEIEEGSLMDYLLEQAENASGLTEDAIQDALYALDRARDVIQSLER